MKNTYIVSLQQDEDAENPRTEYPNLGTLYTWHPRYLLGGKDDYNCQERINNYHTWVYNWLLSTADQLTIFGNFGFDFETLMYEDHEADAREQDLFQTLIQQWVADNCKILPVYLYDHSGITISTHPFSCPWDSGQVGFIYITKPEAEKHGLKFEECESVLKGEIETLNQFLTGDVWWFSTYWIDHKKLTEEGYETVMDDFFEGSDPKLLHEDENRKIYVTNCNVKESPTLEWIDGMGGCYGYKYAIECIIDNINPN